MGHDKDHAIRHRTAAGGDPLTDGAKFLQYISVWYKFEVAFDDASGPKITVQDGDCINAILAEVTTVWDGNGTANVGDGGDAAGFLADGDINKGVAGYYGCNHDERGAYLYHAGFHDITKCYEGADTIDVSIVQGTSTQGAMTVWVEIIRLK